MYDPYWIVQAALQLTPRAKNSAQFPLTSKKIPGILSIYTILR
jgi:hypothetical protein